MEKLIAVLGLVVGSFLLVLAVAGLFAFFVKLLWNGLCPVLFHLPPITFWQAWGLMILSHFLFGNSTSVKSSK